MQSDEAKSAQGQRVAVVEEAVELRAVAGELRAGVEDLAEHLLHPHDLAADGELAAEPRL